MTTQTSNTSPAMPTAVRNLTAEVEDPEVKKELRIAMTMNGGVSLAVYIGGVAHEFNRLTRSEPYADLLDAIGYSPPVIDVITGTSAGGINAAALALAQANVNSDFAALRDLWVDRGQISDLLREPFHSGAPSLLKGDDYLYPEIRNAFAQLIKNYERATVAADDGHVHDALDGPVWRPVDLTITTTLLSPVPAISVDDLGSKIEQPKHAGQFRFTTESTRNGNRVPDMFAEWDKSNPDDHSIVRTVEALALAARATASFPAAFEPTLIPVNCTGERPDGRPDMADYVDPDWLDPDDLKADRSRYAVDGGVLANTPLRHALRAIHQQRVSNTLVRRVLVLVHPHAVTAGAVVIPADSSKSPPTLISGLAGVMGASSSVGSLSYVEDVHKHNEQALRARDGRRTTLEKLPSTDEVDKFLLMTWPLIRHLRLRRAAFVLADQIKDTENVPLTKVTAYADALLQDEDSRGRLPFLPKEPPDVGGYRDDEWQWGLDLATGITTLATDLLRTVVAARRKFDDSEGIIELAVTAWNHAVNGGVRLDRLGHHEERQARGDVIDPDASVGTRVEARVMAVLAKYRRRMGPPEVPIDGDDAVQQLSEADSRWPSWLIGLVRGRLDDELDGPAASVPGDADHHGTRVMAILDGVANSLYDVIAELNRVQPAAAVGVGNAVGRSVDRRSVSSLLDPGNLLRVAVGNGGISKSRHRGRELLCLLHRIELISYSFGERDMAETVHTAPIEFAQLSAQIQQDFADRFSSDDKLAGMSLNRFGAFLKRSWRANDWIWGRLDAIKLMMLLTLTPPVLRGVCQCPGWKEFAPAECAEKFIDRIVALTAPSKDVLTYQCFCRTGELQELRKRAVAQVVEALAGDDAPLTDVASLAAYGFQIRAAEEDVPWLAGTIRDDEADGGSGFQTTAFLHRLQEVDRRAGSSHIPRGYTLLNLFVESKVGQEALSEQLPTDLMIRTAATAAAATVTALSSDRSGLGVARPLTRGLRGMVALPYWVLFGLSGRGQLGRALSATTLAFGVALLVLALVAELPGVLAAIVPTVGAASLLTVLVYAAFRTQSVVHSAALLGLFIPITACGINRIAAVDAKPSDTQASTATVTAALSPNSMAFVLLCLALVIGGAVLVANMRTHNKTPLRSLREVATRAVHHVKAWLKDPWRIVRTFVLAAVIAGLTWLVAHNHQRVFLALEYVRERLWADIAENPWLALLVAVGIAAVGGVFAVWAGDRLRPRPVDGRRRLLTDPAGIATAWSPVYGFLYLALAIGIVTVHSQSPDEWVVVSFALSVVFGVSFCLILVFAIPAQRKRRLIRRLAARYGPGRMPATEEFQLSEFEKLGELSRYLTNRDGTKLSRSGERVLRRARRQHQRKYIHAPKARVTSGVG
ncbi:patatin-like protein [Mycobacterium sp. AMU20-3851]|uniref:patatin-like protein n=1 Tax=Mycobacterium sp. AMU20-3851 TaxID=3122055 RepID=UPI003754AAB3